MISFNEKHFKSPKVVRDIVIGMSDGLTVPFALAAGLTGVVAGSTLVVMAGFAEIVAGSISMGLGGYLAAKNDSEHYVRERSLEEKEVQETPKLEEKEVQTILEEFGIKEEQTKPVLSAFRKNHEAWVNFMMQNELKIENPDPKRQLVSALTIAGAYAVGGIVPLSPYLFFQNAHDALLPSVIVTALALFLFGYFKAKVGGINPFKSALQTILVGGAAAGAAYLLAKLISQSYL